MARATISMEEVREGLTFEQAEDLLRGMAGADLRSPPPLVQPSLPDRARSFPSLDAMAMPAIWQPPPARDWDEVAMRAVLESVPDAVIAIEPSGLIVLVNGQTESLFGYPRGELLGRPIEMLLPERFRMAHVGQREHYFNDPKLRPMGERLDLWGRHRSGREFPVEISLCPLRTNGGLFVTATVRDISQRRQAELQLRHAEARYRTLVEEIPAVTFMASLEERARRAGELYVSPQIESLLGFTQREWLEDPVLWFRQLHPADRDRWHVEFARTCATGEPFDSIYRFIARDGRVVWVHGHAKMVRDRDGRPLFLQGVAFDITGSKQAEEALAQLNETLARRVAEAVADAEARSHELARSNEALKNFTDVASHDLREPLRTVTRQMRLLERQDTVALDGHAREYITKSIAGMRQMEQLIDDLHTYARIGREVTFTAIDCAAVLAEACGNLRAALEESHTIVTAGPLPTVQGGKQEMVLLFQNLLENAIKFRALQAPAIEVGARRDDDHWLFWVTDNGIGIEAQYLERIFNTGERLSRKIPGTGFGLAHCRKIVEHHRGAIWVESQPGAGSTFWFTLPAA
ncbi:MAG TPA: PAS domain S-box protein [Pirellulales bacterium]|nr:PAS domain S-box protein [Pirellulales bacterium]